MIYRQLQNYEFRKLFVNLRNSRNFFTIYYTKRIETVKMLILLLCLFQGLPPSLVSELRY